MEPSDEEMIYGRDPRPLSETAAVSVEALAGARLRVAYADGLDGVVSLGQLIAATPYLAPLRDPERFAQVRVAWDGDAFAWPDDDAQQDIEVGAHGLRSRVETGASGVPVTPAELEEAGEALFGRNWKTELAETLGVKDAARLRAMMRGDRPIPNGFRVELARLTSERAAQLARISQRLDTAAPRDAAQRTTSNDAT